MAMDILARAGQLPGHLITYLQGVQAWEEAAGAPPSRLRAHPPAQQRIQLTRRHLPAAAALLASQCQRYSAWRNCVAAAM
jgi:predicted Zn-dependent protease